MTLHLYLTIAWASVATCLVVAALFIGVPWSIRASAALAAGLFWPVTALVVAIGIGIVAVDEATGGYYWRRKR